MESLKPKLQDEDEVKTKTTKKIAKGRDRNYQNSTANAGKEDKFVGLVSDSFWLTRVLFLRSLAFIYFVAFLVAYHQNEGLIGSNGLLPVKNYIRKIKKYYGSNIYEELIACPSILLFIEESNYDYALNVISLIGITISFIVLIQGAANMLMMFSLWLLYHSIVNVGQVWYGFGWESQILETGFLAIFFCPLLNIQKFPENSPPSKVVVYCYRWLLFRIMLGAGLIKIRGDECWRDLTCMDYHYQTQPVPNPLSYYLHQSPQIVHKMETFGNHVVELVVPFLLFLPRICTHIAGWIQIVFQVILILSGNLSFLNWLTILPPICCFDDRSLARIFPKSHTETVAKLQKRENNIATSQTPKSWGRRVRSVVHFLLFCLIAYLSVPVVKNLVSQRQAMNRSFDSLRIVNTYGAFGSVTKSRTEVVLQGTHSTDPLAHDAHWMEYEFNCKPGNVTSRPCVISPYHYRLDWLMWFAAFQNYQRNPWLVHLIAKLLVNDKLATSLIKHNPFQDGQPPKFIRAVHFKYTFTKIGRSNKWWKRKKLRDYIPPVNRHQLKDFLKTNDFPALLPP